jgi:phosphatidylglycerol:prolipoprotein diacylglycerol transferase
MLYLGLVAGVVAGNAAAHAAGVDAFRVYLATLILIPAGLIGARLFYVASHWRFFRQNPRRIWNRREGGASQYGALLVVLPLSVPLLAQLRLDLGAFWDVVVFTILVSMIFGRIGCLLNGCCAGRPSESWMSMRLPNLERKWQRRLPAQGLEAAWAAALLVCAIFVRQHLPFAGALFLVVMAGYAAGRLVLESTREQPPGTARFTVALIVLSLATVAARWPK